MEKTSVILSVFHDGQFFTALFERTDAYGFSAARTVFAAKPSDHEILELILKSYGALRFCRPCDDEGPKPLAANPKRRQREAAKASRLLTVSTKAQQALKAQHVQQKAALAMQSRERRQRDDDEKFEKKQLKRKQKHKGR